MGLIIFVCLHVGMMHLFLSLFTLPVILQHNIVTIKIPFLCLIRCSHIIILLNEMMGFKLIREFCFKLFGWVCTYWII